MTGIEKLREFVKRVEMEHKGISPECGIPFCVECKHYHPCDSAKLAAAVRGMVDLPDDIGDSQEDYNSRINEHIRVLEAGAAALDKEKAKCE